MIDGITRQNNTSFSGAPARRIVNNYTQGIYLTEHPVTKTIENKGLAKMYDLASFKEAHPTIKQKIEIAEKSAKALNDARTKILGVFESFKTKLVKKEERKQADIQRRMQAILQEQQEANQPKPEWKIGKAEKKRQTKALKAAEQAKKAKQKEEAKGKFESSLIWKEFEQQESKKITSSPKTTEQRTAEREQKRLDKEIRKQEKAQIREQLEKERAERKEAKLREEIAEVRSAKEQQVEETSKKAHKAKIQRKPETKHLEKPAPDSSGINIFSMMKDRPMVNTGNQELTPRQKDLNALKEIKNAPEENISGKSILDSIRNKQASDDMSPQERARKALMDLRSAQKEEQAERAERATQKAPIEYEMPEFDYEPISTGKAQSKDEKQSGLDDLLSEIKKQPKLRFLK
jgi:hypothetical protein